MKVPSIPVNERQRRDALHALGLLDTAKEERFERFVRLARALIDVPIAAISLIDDERQWFKSCVGLDATETSRDVSFCGHAILQRGTFYIPDALADPRFADNPLVTGAPFIRFYAGCPLALPGDLPVATLCVIDTRPRALTPTQLARLRDLADCLQRELLLHMLLSDVANLTSSPSFATLTMPG